MRASFCFRCILVVSQALRQSRCTRPMVPVHLQAEIRGFSLVCSSIQQKRQWMPSLCNDEAGAYVESKILDSITSSKG